MRARRWLGLLLGCVAGFAVTARAAMAQSDLVCWQNGCFPVPALPAGRTFVQMATSTTINAALLSDGSIIAWGVNDIGQCNVPVLPSGLTYVEVEVGLDHMVARRSDGSIVAWGSNPDGQCDVPALPPGLRYTQVSAGGRHNLALRSDGSVVAWGNNRHGQCNVPPPPSGVTYVEVAAGGDFFNTSGLSHARRSDGSVAVWGEWSGVMSPPSGQSFVAIDAGGFHAIALLSDGSLQGWGSACGYGQCDEPAFPPGVTYRAVSAGEVHTVALRSDGSVAAWGWNGAGQCNVPPAPSGLAYVEVSAGMYSTLARVAGCPTCEVPFCLGDGSSASVRCPCGNDGGSGHGCDNSASTGGAMLTAQGSVDPDQVVLGTTGELTTALSIFIQGSSVLGDPVTFGDGTRCVGGRLKRIGVKTAVAGAATYPGSGDASISARSAALGDLIRPGTYRYYQVHYHDPSPSFCNAPRATFNASNAVMVRW